MMNDEQFIRDFCRRNRLKKEARERLMESVSVRRIAFPDIRKKLQKQNRQDMNALIGISGRPCRPYPTDWDESINPEEEDWKILNGIAEDDEE